MHEGLAEGHNRAQDAADHAGEDWQEQAMNAFRSHAEKNKTFTTEQVRAAHPELPEPPDKRAWGAIPRIAKRRGIVNSHGWTRADSHTVHGMVVTLWKSNIYTGECLEQNAS